MLKTRQTLTQDRGYCQDLQESHGRVVSPVKVVIKMVKIIKVTLVIKVIKEVRDCLWSTSANCLSLTVDSASIQPLTSTVARSTSTVEVTHVS